MKQINSDGPTILEGLPGQSELSLEEFVELRDTGATVIDLRDQYAFARAHIPNAINIGIDGFVSVWASWVVSHERPIVFVGGRELGSWQNVLEEATRALIRVGLDDIRGSLVAGFDSWCESGNPVSTMNLITPGEVADRRDEFDIIDVRMPDEYQAGHVPGARNDFIGTLIENVKASDRPRALFCKTGYRSAVAVSTLQAQGVGNLFSIAGGLEAWQAEGLGLDTSQ